MIDKTNTQSTLHFLMNAEFITERGYSYGELLNYLITFQTYYRECYTQKEHYEKELIHLNQTLEFVKDRIINSDKLLKEKEDENRFLITKIDRRLSFWERLTGKIKIKY